MRIFGRRHVSIEALSNYLDGYLTARNVARIERHLAACVRCRAELESIRVTIDLVRRVPQVAPTRSFKLAEVPVLRPPKGGYAWGMGLATSVAALTLVVLVALDLSGIVPGEETIIPAQERQEATGAAPPLAEGQAPARAAEVEVTPQPKEVDEGSRESVVEEKGVSAKDGGGLALWPWEVALTAITITLAVAAFWAGRRARAR